MSEGGGDPANFGAWDWGAAREGVTSLDYGCGDNPKNDAEGTWGHAPEWDTFSARCEGGSTLTTHGTRTRYLEGCECGPCREANAIAKRAMRAARKPDRWVMAGRIRCGSRAVSDRIDEIARILHGL